MKPKIDVLIECSNTSIECKKFFFSTNSLLYNYNPPFSSFDVEKLYTKKMLCIQTKNGVFQLKNLNISHVGGLKNL
jgi:hypothetical protein